MSFGMGHVQVDGACADNSSATSPITQPGRGAKAADMFRAVGTHMSWC
jgi:hypothetical protein